MAGLFRGVLLGVKDLLTVAQTLSPAPLTPVPSLSLTWSPSRTERGAQLTMWRAALGRTALGRVPLGGTGLVDPQAGLDQVWGSLE